MQQEGGIDYNKYSRQIATYGAEAMGKLVQLKVLVHGLQGVGIESVKNLVLAGPAQVHIHDDELVQIKDLGVNFYAEEKHVGKVTRADASVTQLKELNPLVDVSVIKGELTNDVLAQYSVVVYTEFYNRQRLIEANEFCRSRGIGFITTGNLGLYGYAFLDYGENHIVFDTNGEAVRNCIIVNVTQDKEAVVTCHEDKRHGFEDGDTILFREVEGMTQINGQQFKIKDTKSHSFVLENCDTTSYGAYTGQGIVEQVKVQQSFKFKSFKESLQCPHAPGRNELDMLDWEKFGYPEQLHLVLNGVYEYAAKNNNQLPELNNAQQADQLVQIVKGLNTQNSGMEIEGIVKLEEVNEDLVRNTALFARANITPLASFWGGIVAQEVIKFTGKYTPLRQWLHYEVFEALPEGDHIDRKPVNCRYDDIISIFGSQFMDTLSKQKTFMIGAGALGCEYLKMFALMGLGTNNGNVTVTDDDQIEISNLNRQFLFRRDNVGHSKAECAANAVKGLMNPQFNVDAVKLRVCPENEEFFNDKFWNGLDFVVNAVDNVKARMFVDSRCVWYHKPLFEAGTLGTKCNSQVVVPKHTQSYGDSVDPPEEGIPLCTLKNFPNQIEHCIQYARDKFEEYLVEGPNECIKYIQNPQKYIKETQAEYAGKPGIFRAKLETVKKLSGAYIGGTIEHLIELARNLWAENFHNQIASLLNAYPVDAKTSEGAQFWSGPKRAPQILDFDANDQESITFIQSFANIMAFVFGIQQIQDVEQVKKIVSQIQIPKFVPKKIAIKVNEKDTTVEKSEDDDEIINNLLKELTALQISQRGKLNPIEFEKDDPTNWHIEFVSSMSNLRGRNYKIKEVTAFQVKIIAGKIIPALATTTAMVVGAVGIEIIKCILGKPVSKQRNSFMNLALPLWLFSEPLPPIQAQDKDYDEVLMGPVRAIPPKFTTWDKISVTGPLTLQGLIDWVQTELKVTSSIISSGKACIYNSYAQNSKDKLDVDIAKIIEDQTGTKIPDYKLFLELEICGDTEDGIDATMPTFKYAFKGL